MASGRLEALGDGIFSVAMTILVIELSVPVIKGNSWKDLQQGFHESWYGLLCYMISFIVLGIMWFGHRMMFEYIGKTNRHFIFMGVLFYMVVCLVPFSTRFLARYTFQWSAIFVYGLNLSLCALCAVDLWIQQGTYAPPRNTARSKKRSNNSFPAVSGSLYFCDNYCAFYTMGKYYDIHCNTSCLFIAK